MMVAPSQFRMDCSSTQATTDEQAVDSPLSLVQGQVPAEAVLIVSATRR